MAAFQTAPSPSPHALWMCRILSTDLQTPLHDQSKDATHTFPARFFHSQSAQQRDAAGSPLLGELFRRRGGGAVPGGVAQHMLRSSTCSTSSPISHAPRETSSFANLCRIGLETTHVRRQAQRNAATHDTVQDVYMAVRK